MDDLVALLAVFCIFGLPVFGWIAVRTLQHRERMEMIRHGVVPPAGNWKDWKGGAGIAPQAVPPRLNVPDDEAQRTLKKGIVVTFIGLALTFGLACIGFLIDPPHFVLGPWLLGGLIPLFVGLAQVVTALLFGATFPGVTSSARYSLGPQQQAPSSAPPPTFEGAYTYRPDPNTQELGRSAPPDRR
ncbi:MAG: hypothetical protein JO043_10555 [Candidatus Eremiobacteraeota bacterium]|nr:hypothetical protein [Candidatus Eremiobacteraeota bacterium]